MDTTSVSIILGLLLPAVGLGYLGYRSDLHRGKWTYLAIAMRSLAFWMLFVLLYNPAVSLIKTHTVKPVLHVVVDNSASMNREGGGDRVKDQLEALKNNDELNSRFDMAWYTFGSYLTSADSLYAFNAQRTDISGALTSLKNLTGSPDEPVILLSDGNYNYGRDYQFNNEGLVQPVYSVVTGDTTVYSDLYIQRINVNRYAYSGNTFPVEIFPGYRGRESATTTLEVFAGNRSITRQTVAFEPGIAPKPITLELKAGAAGLVTYTVVLDSIESEQVTANNRDQFAVEVVDRKLSAALISKVSHPDLGLLKKIIERGDRREAQLLRPEEAEDPGAYDLFILYMPDRDFEEVLTILDEADKNYWLITPPGTDWEYLNQQQPWVDREITYTSEEVFPVMNPGFGLFQVDDPGLKLYPPLNSMLGQFLITGDHETLLYRAVSGVETGQPLLFMSESGDQKKAILDGEGLWRWRLWFYAENKSFDGFDEFWSGFLQYLASGKKKQRLDVSYETFYYANESIVLRANYYDRNLRFDPGASLLLEVKHKDSANYENMPMQVTDRSYKQVLSGLPPGEYEFRVSVPSQNISRGGNFQVLISDLESQTLTTDVGRMRNIALRTGGALYTLEGFPDLMETLETDQRYRPVQKNEEKIVPLLEWKALLFLLVAFVSLEWFLRKYNGLI